MSLTLVGAGSTGSGVATGKPVIITAPTVTGSLNQGQILSTTTGVWANFPTSYTYQWYNSNIGLISGATSSTYTTQTADFGYYISCVVTASNTFGSTAATSNSVGPIIAFFLPPATSLNAFIIPSLIYISNIYGVGIASGGAFGLASPPNGIGIGSREQFGIPTG